MQTEKSGSPAQKQSTPASYIFVCNSVDLPSGPSVTPDEIMHSLMARRFWALTSTAPFRAKLQRGDRVLIYLAGVGFRVFAARAVVDGEVSDISADQQAVLDDLGLPFFSYSVRLRECVEFPKPVRIAELVPRLQFIRDKRNYGLHLRLSVVRITSGDYDLVVDSSE